MKYRYNIRTGISKIKTKTTITISALGLGATGLAAAVVLPFSASAAGGFDQYGYNRSAHIFQGTASGWCLAGGQAADCLGAYSNDHLVMKWNAAWDACNAHGYDDATYCAGAWDTNEWNGNVPGGSGVTEHVKIIWVGSAAEASPYWRDGGYSIWGNYEAITDRGMDNGTQFNYAAASPNGLGGGLYK